MKNLEKFSKSVLNSVMAPLYRSLARQYLEIVQAPSYCTLSVLKSLDNLQIIKMLETEELDVSLDQDNETVLSEIYGLLRKKYSAVFQASLVSKGYEIQISNDLALHWDTVIQSQK